MYSELSDSELIRKLPSCSDEEKKEVFLTLYDRYGSLVLKVAYSYLKDYDRAGDLMHDVFLRVIQKADGIKDPDVFKSWLMTVTRNLCVDSLRQTSFVTEEILDETMEVSFSEKTEDVLIAEMDRQKMLGKLSDCIQRLEEFDLGVFQLRWQGLKAAHIGKILGKDQAQVRHSYYNIRRILETCMQRKGLNVTIAQLMSLGEIDEEQ